MKLQYWYLLVLTLVMTAFPLDAEAKYIVTSPHERMLFIY